MHTFLQDSLVQLHVIETPTLTLNQKNSVSKQREFHKTELVLNLAIQSLF